MTLDALTPAKKRLAQYDALDDEFSGFRGFMVDVNKYILPRRGMFNDDTKPQGSDFASRHDLIIDGHATRANRTLGAGMQGGLVSPSRPWVKLSLLDTDLAEYGPNKRWLHEAEQIMYKVYAKSNFYNQIHTVFEEEGGFGTAVMVIDDDFNDVVNFKLMTAGTYRLANGTNGMVNTVGRKVWYQAHQLVEKFGEDKVHSTVREAMQSNPYTWFQILHFIEPNTSRQRSKIDNANMPWLSVYVDHINDIELLKTGYKETPFAAPRWNTVGNWAYGLGPGSDVRGQVKMLQEMQKSVIMALHKEIDPPMGVPAKFKGVLSLIPGATNYMDMTGNDKVGPLYQIQLDISRVLQYVDSIKDNISKDYYNDLFLMIAAADKSMTATEVAERHEEKLLLLGPTIERQEKELLNVVNDRVFSLCMRNGLFPEPPEDLAGQDIKFEYVSLLSQAQKLITGQSINAHMSLLERVGQINPEAVMATTDFIELISTHSSVVGVPPKITRTKSEAEEFLAGIKQAQAKAAQQEQALQAAQVVGRAPAAGGGGDQLAQLAQSLGV